ncbi:TonB-dependent receptor [Mucilaginibacter rubeus]|uniref:TonB-dependent receptor n=1 Tax=Mucilaginibacter rubeus TaxID=2027860 RepID=A0AAE6MLM5_9SPHI|nr:MULTISPECIES: outer membrane beta-barrel family protein [Mucilaginibacter]QEM07387.1 TonB-dependent receptor [Mucilaginibacter rubeus]QEM19841.1 TonB-dependent receptor [Mucilaginibacter gossypii]QTE43456.1 TonB-dependent receptor [Mucilaginibacter rubeus]QTE50056.1 TonB-dependent receptor [Mucilaginibacter rubeus]QTE55145.1 TonB-dependent receptor [Mucilaginibacter rubeus]
MKAIIHNIFYTLLLVAISCSVSFAQQAAPAAKVSGALVNEQGKPLDYATVSLLRASDSTVVKGALSNDAGVYVFDNIKAGNYIIKATVVGYQKAVSKSFTVPANTPHVTAPALNLHTGSTELKGVTITATKPLIERKIDRTVMNVENSVLAAGNTAMEILERAPGVTVDKDDNISLKGKQGVTVMINDKLTYLTAAQLATLLRSTDGNTIKSIEIITNPSAKYDAAGNSGIINIKLKKNTQSGTNGSITVGGAKSKYWRDNSSLNLNHKQGNLNVFTSLSRGDNKRGHDIGIDRIITDSLGNKTYFNQKSSLPSINHYNNYRLGADYDLTPKHTIGFVVSGYSNSEKDLNDNRTIIGKQFGVPDSSLHTTSDIRQTYKNFALNLNDRLKLDTSGQELSIDLDYSKFKNNSNAMYNTDYFLPDGSIQHEPQMLRNQTPSTISIYTGKADYTKPLTKTIKLEAGVKFSSVKTDNDLQAQIFSNGAYINDTTRTNRFIYTEKINAGYLNLNKQFKKFSVQLGLRAEQTRSTGNLIGSTPVKRSYLNLFPSVFINQTINDKNEVSFSYSRRIDRPGYDDLNPFVYYLDPYTYSQGNAFLNPQYTQNFELNYTYNKTINVSLGYSHTTDAITELILTEGKRSFETHQNLQTQTGYNININTPFTITKWWEGNVNATAFYLGFKSDTLAGQKFNDGQWAFQGRTTQTFKFAGYRFEVTGDYQSSLTYGIYKIRPRYSVDMGVSKSFMEKKFNIKASCDDIFNIRRNDLSSQVVNNNFVIKQKNDTRVMRLTFTYNFGNSSIKMRQHRSGADDEKGRVKGNN